MVLWSLMSVNYLNSAQTTSVETVVPDRDNELNHVCEGKSFFYIHKAKTFMSGAQIMNYPTVFCVRCVFPLSSLSLRSVFHRTTYKRTALVVLQGTFPFSLIKQDKNHSRLCSTFFLRNM